MSQENCKIVKEQDTFCQVAALQPQVQLTKGAGGDTTIPRWGKRAGNN